MLWMYSHIQETQKSGSKWEAFILSDGSNTILSNIKRTQLSFFEHPTNLNMFNRAFTRFTNSLIELTRIWFFQTLNRLESVQLLVIKLEHPIFGFEQMDVKHSSTHHYQSSLDFYAKCQEPRSDCIIMQS